MATEVKVKITNASEKQNSIFSNIEFCIRASKSPENQFKDKNFLMRVFDVKESFYLDICDAFGIDVSEIGMLAVFIIDYDYETMGKNIHKFNLQIGNDFIADMSCFVCANGGGFTEKIYVSFNPSENTENIDARLQIVLITK